MHALPEDLPDALEHRHRVLLAPSGQWRRRVLFAQGPDGLGTVEGEGDGLHAGGADVEADHDLAARVGRGAGTRRHGRDPTAVPPATGTPEVAGLRLHLP